MTEPVNKKVVPFPKKEIEKIIDELLILDRQGKLIIWSSLHGGLLVRHAIMFIYPGSD